MKTVLITGASSGIGRAAAQLFLERGWNVIATMRRPDQDRGLPSHPHLMKVALDVLDDQSILAAQKIVQERFGSINVLVNNAGYGLVGVFESMAMESISRQLDTNVVGLIRVTKAFLPLLRTATQPVIINLSSVGGRTTIPLYSIYHATKWAVEGFSESLQYELEPLGFRVKLMEPGAVKTNFVGSSSDISRTDLDAYRGYSERTLLRLQEEGNKGNDASEVANAIYGAATDGRKRLRYIVGAQAKSFLGIQSLLPECLYRSIVSRMFQ